MHAVTILSITFWEFLKFYVILIAAFLPLSVIAIIYLNKKTGLIKKIDNYLDRKLYGEPAKTENLPAASDKKQEPASSESKKTDSETEKPEQKTAEEPSDPLQVQKEKDEDIGIAWFQMKVGDNYRCRINRQTAEQFQNTIGQWTCENSFVGEIVNDKFFHAKKAGRTYVLFGNGNENSAYIYNIEISPSNESWRFQSAMDDVFSKRNINDVKSRLAERPLIRADFNKNLTIFKGEEDIEKYVYEHGVKDTVLRVLYTISGQSEETIKEISENLNDRMKEIEGINSKNIRIWIHEDENEYVDFIAYLRKSSDGKLLFGIGKSWRVNGEETEIALNLPMIEKTFVKCLDGDKLEDDSASLEIKPKETEQHDNQPADEEKSPKTRKQAKSRKKNKQSEPAEETSSNAAEEKADPAPEEESKEPKDVPVSKEAREAEGDSNSESSDSSDIDEDYNPSDDDNYDETDN